ncbi:monovalent cation/H+ antiporter subunit D [Paenirhodobacter sp.]|jgi:multicomponent K+:H+ antiporter subunit D|uniref:monovalent cation/H+ antiporter subunit D n=1 Tax=Paenirhodobacter sp. TaxID=1965326 RepID=UPI003B502B54
MIAAQHLIMAPIVIPLITGALTLLYDERQRRAKLGLSLVSALALLIVSVELMSRTKGAGLAGGGETTFYLLGDWTAPFGIVIVLDRLAAMMVMLTALLAIPVLIYSGTGWHKQGPHFHAMFQFLLMGLNGAFLTGDLFNLFVFFEVLLAASYGLLLHGSGQLRVRGGLHYIAINLAASLLFLIGVSLIYGVTGTLNMAHLAKIVPGLPASELPLFRTGAALLGLAFLVKAGIWPLSFWLPTAYMAAAAPVAAMFAIMTKVGVYVILRLSMLTFGVTAGASAGFGAEVLIAGGALTMIFGVAGTLASQGLGRMVAHLIVLSAGTLLSVTGLALMGGGEKMLGGALYYLVSSTLASGALFLLIEPMSREEGGIAALLALTADAYGIDQPEEDGAPEVGLAIPGTLMVLGLSFAGCVLVLAGLPPLSGFIGKVAMLSGLLGNPALPPWLGWGFGALLLLSGFATLIGLVRIGIQTFWASDGAVPKVFALEIVPVIVLLSMLVLMTLKGQDTLRYMEDTAQALLNPSVYANGVLAAPSVEQEAARQEVVQ